MVAWFIIALATLAVFAFIAVNGVQTVSATTDGVGRVETARRLDAAAAALVTRAGSPNNSGRMMVLAGTSINGVYGLPSELSAYASTPFGQRIVYCPFGDGEGGTGSVAVPQGGGTTYAIQTKADTTGRVYVVAGRPAFPQVAENPNLMGYLVAPRTKTSATPNCSSVRFNPTTKGFEAPDALVRPVIRSSSGDDQRQQAGREVVYYVSSDGNGKGLSPNDPAALYTAVTYYRAALPQAMRIVMTAGSYVLPQQYLNAAVGGFSDKGNAGTLVIEGNGSQLDFDGSGTSDVWIPGNLELRNLSVTTRAGVYAQNGHKVTLNNTSTGFIQANAGGILQLTDVTATDLGRLGYALYVNDGATAVIQGKANLYGANGQNAVSIGGGARASFVGANVNVNATAGSLNIGFYVEENSDLVFKSTQINVNAPTNYGILVAGRVYGYGPSGLSYTQQVGRSIELQRGGFLSLVGGTWGQGVLPSYGLYDSGGSGITGSGAAIRGAVCWPAAYNLAWSPNANGSSSAVAGDEGNTTMSPNPTATEVQNNATITSRNTQRAQLRQTNTSTYTCQTS